MPHPRRPPQLRGPPPLVPVRLSWRSGSTSPGSKRVLRQVPLDAVGRHQVPGRVQLHALARARRHRALGVVPVEGQRSEVRQKSTRGDHNVAAGETSADGRGWRGGLHQSQVNGLSAPSSQSATLPGPWYEAPLSAGGSPCSPGGFGHSLTSLTPLLSLLTSQKAQNSIQFLFLSRP